MALPFSDSYDCNTAHTSESGSYEGVMIPVITEFSQKLQEKKSFPHECYLLVFFWKIILITFSHACRAE